VDCCVHGNKALVLHFFFLLSYRYVGRTLDRVMSFSMEYAFHIQRDTDDLVKTAVRKKVYAAFFLTVLSCLFFF
jgi:hypothetical protein